MDSIGIEKVKSREKGRVVNCCEARHDNSSGIGANCSNTAGNFAVNLDSHVTDIYKHNR